MDNCIKCDANQRDRQGRLCRYCSWKPQQPAPASPPPPTENTRAGADEVEQAAREWIDTWGMPDSLEAVADLIRTKEAAGRARGIEEERKRWDGKCKP